MRAQRALATTSCTFPSRNATITVTPRWAKVGSSNPTLTVVIVP